MAEQTITLTQQQRDLLKGYTEEAAREYGSQNASKQALKDIIEAAAEGTGVDKKVLRKFFKLAYDEKVRDAEEDGAVLGFLADQIGQ